MIDQSFWEVLHESLGGGRSPPPRKILTIFGVFLLIFLIKKHRLGLYKKCIFLDFFFLLESPEWSGPRGPEGPEFRPLQFKGPKGPEGLRGLSLNFPLFVGPKGLKLSLDLCKDGKWYLQQEKTSDDSLNWIHFGRMNVFWQLSFEIQYLQKIFIPLFVRREITGPEFGARPIIE